MREKVKTPPLSLNARTVWAIAGYAAKLWFRPPNYDPIFYSNTRLVTQEKDRLSVRESKKSFKKLALSPWMDGPSGPSLVPPPNYDFGPQMTDLILIQTVGYTREREKDRQRVRESKKLALSPWMHGPSGPSLVPPPNYDCGPQIMALVYRKDWRNG